MSYISIQTRAQVGLDSPRVNVEVHLANGLPCFNIVGLPELAVKESRERVRAAIINSHFQFPSKRITVNLAPAELPKQGGRFDLAIAIGLLLASQQIISSDIHDYEFLGELSLSGKLLKTPGVLPSAHICSQKSRTLITATANQAELQLLSTQYYLLAENLLQVCAHLSETCLLKPSKCVSNTDTSINTSSATMNEVLGQAHAKRALSIAATGHHHVLMIGSPGSGKTMLANRFMSLLTKMNLQDTLETASLHSISNSQRSLNSRIRPLRSPHHSVSAIGLAGGGTIPKPGEISLAHNGVLFLDEFAEFSRSALEILREPIETGKITISRASGQSTFPARFQLIAAMNPCPMGCDLNDYGRCECSHDQMQRYYNKLSAPLLDRIDIQISVPKIPLSTLLQSDNTEKQNWPRIISQIHQSQAQQLSRQGCLNAYLSASQCDVICKTYPSISQALINLAEKFNLTARGCYQVIKLARTIADFENSADIRFEHLTEAISYRRQKFALRISP